ncbi:MAG: hypothetical protein RLZZ416_794 [Candidatus Parcubacteria bacterium]|jgi:ABC-type nitrate/sulfonate/bicarbonate transport system substrate-binding protein
MPTLTKVPLPKVELATADYLPQLDILCHHFASGHVLYLFHALGKGYFKENKIYPVFSRTNHSPKVIESLFHDVHKIGTATATGVILATSEWAAQGNDPKEYPVKIIYQCDQSYSSAFYSLSNNYRQKLGLPTYPKNITTFEDLVGKRVRTGGGTPTILFWILAHKKGLKDKVNPSLEENGYDPGKINLSWVEEYDVKTYSNLMLRGELDVYSKPTFGHGQFIGRAKTTNEGLEHVAFSTIDAGLPPLYGVGIVARRDFVRDHADMIAPFLKAIDKAMPECIDDPRFSVRIMNEMRDFGPEYDEIEGIKADITAGKHPEISGEYAYYASADTEKYGFGCVREDKLQFLIDMLQDAGMLKAKIQPSDVYMDVKLRA